MLLLFVTDYVPNKLNKSFFITLKKSDSFSMHLSITVLKNYLFHLFNYTVCSYLVANKLLVSELWGFF